MKLPILKEPFVTLRHWFYLLGGGHQASAIPRENKPNILGNVILLGKETQSVVCPLKKGLLFLYLGLRSVKSKKKGNRAMHVCNYMCMYACVFWVFFFYFFFSFHWISIILQLKTEEAAGIHKLCLGLCQ